MEAIFKFGVDFFGVGTRGTDNTLGMSKYLIKVMAAMNITFGLLSFSHQFVGHPLKCQGEEHADVEIWCNAYMQYVELREDHVDYQKTVMSFYKLTNWFFLAIGVTFITLSYAWSTWEGGVCRQMIARRKFKDPAINANEENAKTIVHALATFDEDREAYFASFVLAEILHILASVSAFAYFFYVLGIDPASSDTLLYNLRHRARDVQITSSFPRQIGCSRQDYGQGGGQQEVHYKCYVGNQEILEWFHITALFVSGAVLILFCFNAVYLTYKFACFHTFAKRQNLKAYKTLSMNKKFIIMLLFNALSGEVHNLVMEKMAKTM